MRRIRELAQVRDPVNSAAHDFNIVYHSLEKRLAHLLTDQPRSSWRILDLGCGYHFPLVSLLHGSVGQITGIDVEQVFLRDGRLAALRQRKRDWGVLRGVKAATIRYRHYQTYYRVLSGLAGRPFDFAALDLRSYDGRTIPIHDNAYDVVVSNAVLEHVDDLTAFASEVNRVLRPGGWVDCVWHNYFSPSGSHLGPRTAAENPWGHVVGELPTQHLNKVRPEEVRAAFAQWFTISSIVPMDKDYRSPGELDYAHEGLDQLTAAWRLRLADYPEELLTTRGYLIQGAKT